MPKYDYYKAEYIWVDGTEPTAKLRSKAKIIPLGEEPPIWGFDGSSTQQATGDRSDCVLKPVFVCDDPIRGEPHKLVMCEVFLVNGEPHPTNTRAACREVAEKYAKHDTWFGLEQEYTFFDGIKPLGWPDNGFPAPQGGYYCGVGADEVFGRPVVEAHLENCLKAGLKISGINAEVMPGQWEFQVGPVAAPEIGDQLWIARWLLYRTAEDFPATARTRSRRGSIRSRSRATGTAPAATPTSRPSRCARTTTPASPPPRRWARAPTCTSPTTATASRSA